ncbi:uncharacterized protein METZ01_LOCUS133144 [marine metagenome]|uniref:Uncharacterized protein n=1 Tax=marine metagenome TaxID=408172 RepID=A0A381YTK6_9ZZZZ
MQFEPPSEILEGLSQKFVLMIWQHMLSKH